MADTYTDLELDVLREVVNIGSSKAASALSTLVDMDVDVSTPVARVLALTEAIEHIGPGGTDVTAVVIPVSADLQALVLMVMHPPTEAVACELLGVEAGTDIGHSALAELGNILGASYLGAISTLTGLELDSSPPEIALDMLAAVLTDALPADADDDRVLLLESTLSVAGRQCSPALLFIPARGNVGEIFARLGVPA